MTEWAWALQKVLPASSSVRQGKAGAAGMDHEGGSSQENIEDRENDLTIWRGLLLHLHSISQAKKGPNSESTETHTSKLTLTGSTYHMPSPVPHTVPCTMYALTHQSSQ